MDYCRFDSNFDWQNLAIDNFIGDSNGDQVPYTVLYLNGISDYHCIENEKPIDFCTGTVDVVSRELLIHCHFDRRFQRTI